MNVHWQIRLFGGLSAQNEPQPPITRFATQKTAALLAYLALYPNRSHSREALIELLWPDCEANAGRNRLTTLLSFLRHLLEPPGVPRGAVIQADRYHVRLNSDVLTTDVAEFERLLAKAEAASESARLPLLQQAVALYRKEMLPGFYDDWIVQEQMRLAERYARAQQEAASLLEQSGALEAALEASQSATEADPYREDAYRMQMRLLAGLERTATAQQVYQGFERRLQEELGVLPSRATRELSEQIQRDPRAVVRTLSSPAATPAKDLAHQGPDAFGTPASVRPAPPLNLPLQLTRFFGREREIERLCSWLARPDVRLITLTGAGGTGKTRLAVEAVRQGAELFAGRVWFVDLAPIADSRLVPFALVHALKLAPLSQGDPLERAVQALGSAPGLLILDNFEHLLGSSQAPRKNEFPQPEGSTLLVRMLLERAPALKCLVTSRQPLRLGGEQELAVPVLPMPERKETPERLLTCESVALYVDRARIVRPDFALTAHNAAIVAALCRRLEGVPLAIEMAAAWAKTLPPSKMLQRLEQRLDLLVSRRCDVPARQKSLRATIEWSYDLLEPSLQRFFARLSVFQGGWTLEAAEAVCGCPEKADMENREPERADRDTGLSPSFPPLDVLDLMAGLVDKSLVLVEEHGEEARYRLLESVLEFAWEKLVENGEAGLMQSSHTDYFLGLAEASEGRLAGPEQAEWLERLESEQGNLRAAQARIIDRRDAERALRLGSALGRFWQTRGYLSEGRTYLAQALALEGGEGLAVARTGALNAAGALAYRQGDYTASQRLHQEALALCQNRGSPAREAQSLNNLGLAAHALGRHGEAQELYAASLAIERELGNKAGAARSLNNLGNVAADQGDLARAQALYEEALAINLELENREQAKGNLNNLGAVLADRGDADAARTYFESALALCRESGDPWGIANALNNLGNMAVDQGDLARAQALCAEALALNRELGSRAGEARSMYTLGVIAGGQGDSGAARGLLEASLALRRAQGDRYSIAGSLDELAAIERSSGDGAKAHRYLEESLRIRRELGDRVGIAQSLANAAQFARAQGQLERAVRLLASHDALRDAVGAPLTNSEQTRYDPAIADLRALLGDSLYHAAYAGGRALSLEQAMDFALAEPIQDQTTTCLASA